MRIGAQPMGTFLVIGPTLNPKFFGYYTNTLGYPPFMLVDVSGANLEVRPLVNERALAVLDPRRRLNEEEALAQWTGDHQWLRDVYGVCERYNMLPPISGGMLARMKVVVNSFSNILNSITAIIKSLDFQIIDMSKQEIYGNPAVADLVAKWTELPEELLNAMNSDAPVEPPPHLTSPRTHPRSVATPHTCSCRCASRRRRRGARWWTSEVASSSTRRARCRTRSGRRPRTRSGGGAGSAATASPRRREPRQRRATAAPPCTARKSRQTTAARSTRASPARRPSSEEEE